MHPRSPSHGPQSFSRRLPYIPTAPNLGANILSLEDEDIRQAVAFAAALVHDNVLPLRQAYDRLLQSQGRVSLSRSWQELKDDR